MSTKMGQRLKLRDIDCQAQEQDAKRTQEKEQKDISSHHPVMGNTN